MSRDLFQFYLLLIGANLCFVVAGYYLYQGNQIGVYFGALSGSLFNYELIKKVKE